MDGLKRGLWTDDETDRMIAMRDKRMTVSSIAKALNRPFQSVKGRIRTLGVAKADSDRLPIEAEIDRVTCCNGHLCDLVEHMGIGGYPNIAVRVGTPMRLSPSTEARSYCGSPAAMTAGMRRGR